MTLRGVEGELQAVVGRNIRIWRRAQGLSQEVFGEQVGWHRTFVGAVERGERNLTLKSVERISDQLGILPLELLWDREAVTVELDAGGSAQLRASRSGTRLQAAEPGGVKATTKGTARPGARRPRPTP